MRFTELSLIEPILRAVGEEGYSEPTPVQEQSIPHVLAGRDLLAIAQTGTGKTAAFALPVLQRLAQSGPARTAHAPHPSPPPHAHRAPHAAHAHPGSHRPSAPARPIRALVLTPTRELAAQVGDAFRTYGRHLPLRHAVVFGGVAQRPQEQAIAHGIDVLVATPGRLLDLMQQRLVRFDRLEVLVLDEADRMLDMGFLPAVRRVLAAVPPRRQTLFFSATMEREPQALADEILNDAARVEVTPQATTVEKVSQSVYFVAKGDKQALLEHLLADASIARALVFTRTKHGANKVVAKLLRAGIDADAIHANKSQRQRERALAGFREGRHRVLVATDIAARGIDVDDITHVVNFDVPNVPEAYVHRIGRTARAGAEGAAIAFCDADERAFLRDIERTIRMRVPVVEEHPFRRGGKRPGDAMPAAASAPEGAPPAWVATPAETEHRGHGDRPHPRRHAHGRPARRPTHGAAPSHGSHPSSAPSAPSHAPSRRPAHPFGVGVHSANSAHPAHPVEDPDRANPHPGAPPTGVGWLPRSQRRSERRRSGGGRRRR